MDSFPPPSCSERPPPPPALKPGQPQLSVQMWERRRGKVQQGMRAWNRKGLRREWSKKRTERKRGRWRDVKGKSEFVPRVFKWKADDEWKGVMMTSNSFLDSSKWEDQWHQTVPSSKSQRNQVWSHDLSGLEHGLSQKMQTWHSRIHIVVPACLCRSFQAGSDLWTAPELSLHPGGTLWLKMEKRGRVQTLMHPLAHPSIWF